MKTKDEKLTEVVVLTLIGRTALPIGLTVLLTHAFFGRPAGLVLPLAGAGTGVLLLAGAASRLNDPDFLTAELARGLAIAAGLIAALSVRLYFHRVPHRLSSMERIAGIACAAGCLGALLSLRRGAPDSAE